MGLATFWFSKWQVPWDLPLFNARRFYEVASPLGLATFEFKKWQVPGLATFYLMKWQVPWDLPLFNPRSGKSHGTCHFLMGLATFLVKKWQVPWQVPCLNYMGKYQWNSFLFWNDKDPWFSMNAFSELFIVQPWMTRVLHQQQSQSERKSFQEVKSSRCSKTMKVMWQVSRSIVWFQIWCGKLWSGQKWLR